jgi:hypothetical protein
MTKLSDYERGMENTLQHQHTRSNSMAHVLLSRPPEECSTIQSALCARPTKRTPNISYPSIISRSKGESLLWFFSTGVP